MLVLDWITCVITHTYRHAIGSCILSMLLFQWHSVNFYWSLHMIVEPSGSTWHFVIDSTLWTWLNDVLACDKSKIFPLYKGFLSYPKVPTYNRTYWSIRKLNSNLQFRIFLAKDFSFEQISYLWLTSQQPLDYCSFCNVFQITLWWTDSNLVQL